MIILVKDERIGGLGSFTWELPTFFAEGLEGFIEAHATRVHPESDFHSSIRDLIAVSLEAILKALYAAMANHDTSLLKLLFTSFKQVDKELNSREQHPLQEEDQLHNPLVFLKEDQDGGSFSWTPPKKFADMWQSMSECGVEMNVKRLLVDIIEDLISQYLQLICSTIALIFALGDPKPAQLVEAGVQNLLKEFRENWLPLVDKRGSRQVDADLDGL